MHGERPLFSDLDGTAAFHRDTAVGRVFHPGTVSFREISRNDSVHITVLPENRLSVHVDRLSPLAVGPGGRCRYSVLRAIAHNVVVVFEVVGRMRRGRGARHRCDLECDVTSAQPAGQRVYEFSCKAAGAEGCRWSTRAASEEELVAKVAEHARRAHGVRAVSDTLANYALDVARTNAATR